MPTHFFRQIRIKTLTALTFNLIFLFLFFSPGYVAPADGSSKGGDFADFSLPAQARMYRQQGLEQQKMGNLDAALGFYKKAVEIDPAYAATYNDLGVLYEAYGLMEEAEANYLQALKLDPNFLSAYSNLALFYENRRQTEKAYFCWRKRLELGPADDPWTEKAKKKIDMLMQAIPGLKQQVAESEQFALIQDTLEQKRLNNAKQIEQAKKHFQAAKKFCRKKQYKHALDELNLGLSLNPRDKDMREMVEKIQQEIKEQPNRAAKQELIKDFGLSDSEAQEIIDLRKGNSKR